MKHFITMMRGVILLALVALGAAGDYPVVELATPGISFDDLPYASWLQKGSNDIDVSIELATLLAKNENGSVLMRVNAPVYRNQATGDIAPFGPLLSLKRGGEYKVKLTNNLVKQPPGSNATQDNIGITNFHVHGIHESPGNVDRATASEYIGGDNIFIALESKNIESDAGESITLFGTLPEDHLPGNHWYVIEMHGMLFSHVGRVVLIDVFYPLQVSCTSSFGNFDPDVCCTWWYNCGGR